MRYSLIELISEMTFIGIILSSWMETTIWFCSSWALGKIKVKNTPRLIRTMIARRATRIELFCLTFEVIVWPI